MIVPDEGYYVPDEGYYVSDEGYSRKASCALSLISTLLLYNIDCEKTTIISKVLSHITVTRKEDLVHDVRCSNTAKIIISSTYEL